MSEWRIAGEDKTFLYALGPKGTNAFFASFQAAGPERVSREDLAKIVRKASAAPELYEALKALYVAAPTSIDCGSFHHGRTERHLLSEECGPAQAYLAALRTAGAALAKAEGKA